MVAVPSLKGEDAKRPSRERESLVGERTRTINSVKSGLVRLGVRGFNPALRRAAKQLETLVTPEGLALPPNTLDEIRRDLARLSPSTQGPQMTPTGTFGRSPLDGISSSSSSEREHLPNSLTARHQDQRRHGEQTGDKKTEACQRTREGHEPRPAFAD